MLLVIICGNSLTSDHRVIDRFKKPIGIFFFFLVLLTYHIVLDSRWN